MALETVLAPEPAHYKRSTRAHPVSVREEAKALYIAGIQPSQIAQRFSHLQLKATTVSVWAKRDNWVSLRDKVKQPLQQAIVETAKNGLAQASEQAKAAFVSEINTQTAALAKTRSKANLEHLQPRAKTLASLVDSASKVFGWSAEQSGSSFGLTLLCLTPDQAQAKGIVTDVEATPVPEQTSTEPDKAT